MPNLHLSVLRSLPLHQCSKCSPLGLERDLFNPELLVKRQYSLAAEPDPSWDPTVTAVRRADDLRTSGPWIATARDEWRRGGLSVFISVSCLKARGRFKLRSTRGDEGRRMGAYAKCPGNG